MTGLALEMGCSFSNLILSGPLGTCCRCMILRPDGELSLLDLDRGNERRLLSGVERFWLNCGQAKEETDLTKEDPCWAYGPQGMQVCELVFLIILYLPLPSIIISACQPRQFVNPILTLRLF